MATSSNKQFDIQLFPGKVSLWATVEGSEEKIDLISASFHYGLNDIPSGQLTLAMGYNAETLKPSAAHTVLAGIKATTGMKVFCKLEPDVLAAGEIPDGTFMLFDGYTAGPMGMTKSINGQLSLTMQVISWLQDLNYSSAASPFLYPDTPENLFKFVSYTPTLGGTDKMVSIDNIKKLSTGFSQDVWKVLKDLFKKLSSGESVIDIIAQGAPTANQAAADALDRFDNNITTAKLSLDKEFTESPIPQAMAATMVAGLFSTISGGTLWSKLIQASNAFFFDIVAIPDGAAAVPHFRALSGDTFATIKASEQFSVNLQPSMPRQIAALWLLKRKAIGLADVNDKREYGFFVGAADTNQVNKKGEIAGMLLVKYLPQWLSNTLAAANLTTKASAAMPNAQNRKKGTPPNPAAILRMTNDGIGHTMAKALLLLEQYKMRVGSVTGKVRFDIAPGSFVKIEGTGLPTVGFSPNMIADVTQVDLAFSALGPYATTTFTFSHLRTEDELDAGLDKHPMYAEKWNGTALIKGPI